jgi:hypothetical protein
MHLGTIDVERHIARDGTATADRAGMLESAGR